VTVTESITTETLKQGKWVTLKEKYFKDKTGRNKSWEYLERNDGTQAAVIIPIDRRKNRVLLIKQYRYPFEQFVIEFPAGLVDKEEEPDETAYRELLEETGFKAKGILSKSPLLCSSSGLSNETLYVFNMEIDSEEKKSGHTGTGQNLDSTEIIEILLIDLDELNNRLLHFARQGIIIDSKVWSFAINRIYSENLK
jgi:8-oxo-dGTP pyrophosphatase MutT (NUDIX family)